MAKLFYKELGKCMKEARLSKNFTQQDVADRMQITRACVANWENGTRCVYMVDLIKYCDILNVDVNDVIQPVRKLVYKK